MMNKTKIPWCDYTINPVKGLCPMSCDYCYARAMYKRFKWNPEIRMDNYDYWRFPAGSKVFIGSTMELFGNWIDPAWMQEIFCECSYLPNTTFIFLTKQPQNLIRFSPFPDNCWVGASATDRFSFINAQVNLLKVEAKVKFLSLEPLLAPIDPEGLEVDWVIIGAQTPRSEKTFPKWEWVKEIIDACDKANIPVFLKDNLGLPRLSCEGSPPYYKRHPSDTWQLRQEFPA